MKRSPMPPRKKPMKRGVPLSEADLGTGGGADLFTEAEGSCASGYCFV